MCVAVINLYNVSAPDGASLSESDPNTTGHCDRVGPICWSQLRVKNAPILICLRTDSVDHTVSAVPAHRSMKAAPAVSCFRSLHRGCLSLSLSEWMKNMHGHSMCWMSTGMHRKNVKRCSVTAQKQSPGTAVTLYSVLLWLRT